MTENTEDYGLRSFLMNVTIRGWATGSEEEVRAEAQRCADEFRDALNGIRSFTDEEIGRIVRGIGLANAIESEAVLREFGTFIYRLLGKKGLLALLTTRYNRFVEQFSLAVNEAIVLEAMRVDTVLESWVGLPNIEAVSMNTGALYRGTLCRGVPSDGGYSYVLDLGTWTLPFTSFQVRNAVESFDGSRTILLESAHPGIGVPQPQPRA